MGFSIISSQEAPVVSYLCDDRKIYTCVKFCHQLEQLLTPQRGFSSPLFSAHTHTQVVFSPEILSNNRKEEPRKGGGQFHPLVPLLLVAMATGLETKATASTDSRKCRIPPGPALGHGSAGVNGFRSLSTPELSTAGNCTCTLLTVTRNHLSLERSRGESLQHTRLEINLGKKPQGSPSVQGVQSVWTQ